MLLSNTTENGRARFPPGLTSLLILALIQLAIHLLTNGNYGIFRDEFYYIECARHLDWGYVDQPPLSLALLAISMKLFGVSQQAIKILPGIAGAILVFLAGLLARRCGGGRFAQMLAACCALVSPIYLANTGYFSMNAFDLLFWAILFYLLIDILDGNYQRWIWFGVVVGLGLLNKLSVGFLLVGIGVGLLLSWQRRLLIDRTFLLGALIATLLFLPHIIWQIQHGWPTLEFMHNAEAYKNARLNVLQFLGGQILENNPLNAPIWILGLGALLWAKRYRNYRPLGIAYITLFIIFAAANGKVYYLAPFYTVLFAAAAPVVESFIAQRNFRMLKPAALILLALSGISMLPFAVPALPVESFIKYSQALGIKPGSSERHAMGELPQHFADRFGWKHIANKVAENYNRLTPEEKSDCIIYAANYGEAGAINYYNRPRGLPEAVSQHNNFFYWGPGPGSGNLILMVRRGIDDLRENFDSVAVVDTISNELAMPYEANLQIIICRGIKIPLQQAWALGRNFG